jgi:hypothetical protein
LLTALIELCFTDFMASEIVTGYTGAPMQCPAAAGRGERPKLSGEKGAVPALG